MAKKRPSKRPDYQVSPEDFAVAWQEPETVEEVAQRLNMPADAASSRASKYRKLGVKLKKMPRASGRRKLDVDALNRRIAEVNRKSAARKRGSRD